MAQATLEKPVRAAVFATVEQADRAVRRLLAAGFHKDQLAVICSDKHKARFFRDLHKLAPSGSHTAQGVLTGGAIGAAVGGLAALLTGMPALLAAGAVGPFIGAMLTRGLEKELTDYYDQAVEHGMILVAVEVHGEGSEARLAEAKRLLAETGAPSVPLSED